jgi:hypothetical protein
LLDLEPNIDVCRWIEPNGATPIKILGDAGDLARSKPFAMASLAYYVKTRDDKLFCEIWAGYHFILTG